MEQKQGISDIIKASMLKLYIETNMVDELISMTEKTFDNLFSPIATAKFLNLTHATVKYWESKGYFLIPQNRAFDKWRRFTHLECYWVVMLKQLVAMGCSLDIVLPKIIHAFKNSKSSSCEIIIAENAQLSLNDPNEIDIQLVIGFLSYIIAIYFERGQKSLHILNNRCLFTLEEKKISADFVRIAHDRLFETGITICMSDIVDEWIKADKKRTALKKEVYSEPERDLQTLLSNEKVNEIQIKLSKERKIYLIEAIEKFEISDQEYTLQQITKNGKSDVQVMSNNNNKLSLRRSTKKKYD
ncbi:MAG: hypothetical protein ACK5NK_15600 [Niabella sp.]